jgi:hypothetical protein
MGCLQTCYASGMALFTVRKQSLNTLNHFFGIDEIANEAMEISDDSALDMVEREGKDGRAYTALDTLCRRRDFDAW